MRGNGKNGKAEKPERPDLRIKTLFRRMQRYVRIRVEGANAEKLINICLRRKLDLWDLKKSGDAFFFCLSVRSFQKNIRQIVRKTGCSVRITERAGLPFAAARYRRRIPLAVYLLAAAVLLVLCSSVVWDVEIRAPGQAETVLAREILKQSGIYPGAWLRGIDTKEAARKLLIGVDGMKWANVSKSGTLIRVELLPEEKADGQEPVLEGARDLVAEKDALIRKIVVERGTPSVSENTVVLAGETLIAGLVYPIDEMYGTEPRPVSAKGEVTGIVRYSAYAPIESTVCVYTQSGRTAVYKRFSFLGRVFPVPFSGGKLFAAAGSENFEHYNTAVYEEEWDLGGHHRLPVSVITEERRETVESVRELSREEAEEYALFQAMRLLDGKIPESAEILKTGKEIREIDGETCVYIWAECEEKIGVYVRRPETAPGAPGTEQSG